jgi:hypothetical protein
MSKYIKVRDLRGKEVKALTVERMRKVLSTRYENDHLAANEPDRMVNSFWLTHEDVSFPALCVLVRDKAAYVLYLTEEGDPGYYATAGNPKSNNPMTFFMDSFDNGIHAIAQAVVPFAAAVTIANEFFTSAELPKLMNWVKL